MQETPAQYTQRILGLTEGLEPLAVLQGTPGRLADWLAAAPAADWARRPAPGRWSAGEILAHLADTEIVFAWRFRMILATDAVPIQAYDQDLWADAFKYPQVDPHASLALFTPVRKATLALLTRVDPARHAHHGVHAERGRETVPHLMRMWAGHDVNHLKQIEHLLGVPPQARAG
jgi:uncharacterized damage-inducible protein DinB